MNVPEPSPLQPATELAHWLMPRIAQLDPRGYVQGKTQLRDYLCSTFGCSELEAEQALEELVLTGLLEFQGDPTTAGFEPNARWVVCLPDTPVL